MDLSLDQMVLFLSTIIAGEEVAEWTPDERAELFIEIRSQITYLRNQGEWTPTAENINHLPRNIRRYVTDLATRCDPAGDIQALALAKETVKAQEKEINYHKIILKRAEEAITASQAFHELIDNDISLILSKPQKDAFLKLGRNLRYFSVLLGFNEGKGNEPETIKVDSSWPPEPEPEGRPEAKQTAEEKPSVTFSRFNPIGSRERFRYEIRWGPNHVIVLNERDGDEFLNRLRSIGVTVTHKDHTQMTAGVKKFDGFDLEEKSPLTKNKNG